MPPPRPASSRLTDQEGSESFPSLSPDGKFLLYVKSVNGNDDIYLQRVGGGNPLNLTQDSPEDDTQPAFSPDGQQIVFRSEREGGGLFLMGATGESVRRLTDAGYNPAWSPGRPRDRLRHRGRRGPPGAQGQEPARGRGRGERGPAPDRPRGRRPAELVPQRPPHRLLGDPQGELPARDLDDLPCRQPDRMAMPMPIPVIQDDHVNWNPVWAPDGRGLYFVSDRSGSMNVWWVPVDETSGRVQGEPQPVTTSSQSLGLLSVSRDGRQIVYATDDGKSNLERRALDPSALRVFGDAFPVTQGSRAVRSAAVSPDGQWIAFDSSSPQEDLFVVRPDGTGLRQLTDDAAKDRIPRWLPDGSRILFYSDRGGRYGAWTIRADGSGLQPLDHGTGDALYNPIDSPDGRRLVASLGLQSSALVDLCRSPAGRRSSRSPGPATARRSSRPPPGRPTARVSRALSLTSTGRRSRASWSTPWPPAPTSG